MRKLIYFFLITLLHGVPSVAKSTNQIMALPYSLDTFTLFDEHRQREIPVAVYTPTTAVKGKLKPIVFSHGYGYNKGGDYLAYSYLTTYLATQGYCVISIQHELPTDSLLPLTGNPQVLRRPFWDRGVDNILFVINTFKKTHPQLDFEHLTLIGHSNGGDITALFPQKHPGLVKKIITLDNRRMALPKAHLLNVYSLRSSDQPADEGVLPSKKEMKQFKMKIIQLTHTTHNQMDDNANENQRREIQKHLLNFLKD